MRTGTTGLSLTLLLAVLAGCAGRSGGAERPASARTTATVLVHNSNWQDINVFAVRNGARHRLGMVSTHTTRRFDLPPAVVVPGGVRLLVDVIGSRRTWLTEEIQIGYGDSVQFRVQNHLALSHYRVGTR